MVNGIELTVADALVTDSGRSIARIDAEKCRKCGYGVFILIHTLK